MYEMALTICELSPPVCISTLHLRAFPFIFERDPVLDASPRKYQACDWLLLKYPAYPDPPFRETIRRQSSDNNRAFCSNMFSRIRDFLVIIFHF